MRKLCEALLDGASFPMFGDGSQSRDFTHVADAVDATFRAGLAGDPAPIYNVGGGHEATLAEIVALLEDLSGETALLDRRPDRVGDVKRTSADTARAPRGPRLAAERRPARGAAQPARVGARASPRAQPDRALPAPLHRRRGTRAGRGVRRLSARSAHPGGRCTQTCRALRIRAPASYQASAPGSTSAAIAPRNTAAAAAAAARDLGPARRHARGAREEGRGVELAGAVPEAVPVDHPGPAAHVDQRCDPARGDGSVPWRASEPGWASPIGAGATRAARRLGARRPAVRAARCCAGPRGTPARGARARAASRRRRRGASRRAERRVGRRPSGSCPLRHADTPTRVIVG